MALVTGVDELNRTHAELTKVSYRVVWAVSMTRGGICLHAFPFFQTFVHGSLTLGVRVGPNYGCRRNRGVQPCAFLIETLAVYGSLTFGAV